MTRRWLPWAVSALSVLLISSSFFLPNEDWPAFALGAFVVWIGVTSGVGALIASRRTDNPVGWVLVALAFAVALGLMTTQYAAYTLEVAPGALPFGLTAAWLQTWLFIPPAGLLLVLALLFPTGRLPSRRWRWVARIGLLATTGVAASSAFRSGALDALPAVTNPLGVVSRDVTDAVAAISFVALAACIVVALASVFLRLRRARGPERQQVKWFTLAVGALAVLVVAPAVLDTLGAREIGATALGFFLPFLGLLGVPVSIGVAILRYRLYDIDRIISRTFSYAIITVLLGGTFALLVLFPPLVLGRGGADVPDYAIAIATLVVAALFRPVRRRVQSAVDHRFNRRRYDAQHTIDAFATRLREQIDLDTLGAELRTVVAGTVHPSQVTLWIRPPAARS